MEEESTFAETGPSSHLHYGEEVQAALRIFQDAWLSYLKFSGLKVTKENYHRLDPVQSLWNGLLKARKRETGVAYYLDKDQHKQAIQKKNGNNR